MEDQDVNNLLHALENETNASIMKLTTAKIKEHKNNILQQLQLERTELKEMHKKLKVKYEGEKITVDKIGGLECGKCHY